MSMHVPFSGEEDAAWRNYWKEQQIWSHEWTSKRESKKIPTQNNVKKVKVVKKGFFSEGCPEQRSVKQILRETDAYEEKRKTIEQKNTNKLFTVFVKDLINTALEEVFIKDHSQSTSDDSCSDPKLDIKKERSEGEVRETGVDSHTGRILNASFKKLDGRHNKLSEDMVSITKVIKGDGDLGNKTTFIKTGWVIPPGSGLKGGGPKSKDSGRSGGDAYRYVNIT